MIIYHYNSARFFHKILFVCRLILLCYKIIIFFFYIYLKSNNPYISCTRSLNYMTDESLAEMFDRRSHTLQTITLLLQRYNIILLLVYQYNIF